MSKNVSGASNHSKMFTIHHRYGIAWTVTECKTTVFLFFEDWDLSYGSVNNYEKLKEVFGRRGKEVFEHITVGSSFNRPLDYAIIPKLNDVFLTDEN